MLYYFFAITNFHDETVLLYKTGYLLP